MGTLDADGASTTAIGAQTRGVVLTYDARGNGEGVIANTLSGDHQNRVTDYTAIVLRNREGKPGGGKGPLLSPERSLTLGTANDQVLFTHADAFRMVAFGEYATDGTASAIKARDYKDATDLAVGQVGIPRRLTPVECERLMGWPDGWTDVPDEKGKPAPDTARYKACGNGVASPVAAWIGFRLREALEARHA
jgi:site-specific DNA-cytosine methylase